MRQLVIILVCMMVSMPTFAADKTSAFDRVIKTGTIRCGFGIAQPYVVKDPNTGAMSGLFVDVVEQMGKVLNLKIEWAEEIAWDQMTVALQAHKIDMVCSGLWVAASRGRAVAYTRPVLFNAIDIFVRADDMRFDNHIEKLNDSNIILATDDGGLAEEIATKDFPLAQILRAPQAAAAHDLLMNVVTGKADATFNNASYINEFEKQNPGKLRKVKTDRPIRLYHNAFAVEIHEQELRDMLNSAITELEGAGHIGRIMDQYSTAEFPDILYRAAKPYELKE